MRKYDLSGEWTIELKKNGYKGSGIFPGTLDSNLIGEKEEPKATRLTRVVNYVGEAVFSRDIDIQISRGNRAVMTVERAKKLTLFVNGKEIEPLNGANITTAYMWDITEALTENGATHIEIVSDNSYQGWPAEDIINSSASTDETQINYNGLLGELSIKEEGTSYILRQVVLPQLDASGRLQVKLELINENDGEALIVVKSDCLQNNSEKTAVELRKGRQEISLLLQVKDDIKLWDEYEGNLYEANICLQSAEGIMDEKFITFGIRSFKAVEDRLELNGRPVFLRSEASCGLFPEEGHEPMTVEAWKQVLATYKSYGVNHVRFHSHTPPQAAFFAADEMGILMSPELSCWNPKNAFEADNAYEYYLTEILEIVRAYGSHPSFVTLTLGNELQCADECIHKMGQLLKAARAIDSTRLYAIGSNCWYGAKGVDKYSDFYTSSGCDGADLRGTFAAEEGEHVQGRAGNNLGGCINNMYPNNTHDLSEGINAVRKHRVLPVFGFEVGQFEVLPDFDQIDEYKGATRALNIQMVKDKKEEAGIDDDTYKAMVEATGELALLAYKKEVELAMMTEGMSGISLLGLQDFTGQGTALVGMLDAHLKSKPYDFAKPERFAQFFKPVLPILLLPKYTFFKDETLSAKVLLCNFSKETVAGVEPGQRKIIDEINVDFAEVEGNTRIDLELDYEGHTNSYPIWIYDVPRKVEAPEGVYVAEALDEAAVDILDKGGSVFLSPKDAASAFKAIKACHFTTDFWSKGTFPAQDGEMGQFIRNAHPIFDDFPTDMFTNYQWWPMATSYAVEVPRGLVPIITQMDSFDRLRHMAQLFEVRIGLGRLMISTMELTKDSKASYPEVQALLQSIYKYMESDEFTPKNEIDIENIVQLK